LKAAEFALKGEYLVATGIPPTFPHTGLGYIKKGNQQEDGIFQVLRFVEKPDFKLAEDMLDEGDYLWNVGLYIWQVDSALAAYKRYAPDIIRAWQKGSYLDMPDLSIDKAISENADNLFVVEGHFDWSDVGDFEVLWEVNKKDEDGNAVLTDEKGGGWVGIETQGGFFVSKSGQLIVTYGLKNMVVVATRDSILVIPKGDAQKVKDLVNKLREEGRKEVL
jgi:mannose-1-phosphate guanylyltransferase